MAREIRSRIKVLRAIAKAKIEIEANREGLGDIVKNNLVIGINAANQLLSRGYLTEAYWKAREIYCSANHKVARRKRLIEWEQGAKANGMAHSNQDNSGISAEAVNAGSGKTDEF